MTISKYAGAAGGTNMKSTVCTPKDPSTGATPPPTTETATVGGRGLMAQGHFTFHIDEDASPE
jgi:hypothetical protein